MYCTGNDVLFRRISLSDHENGDPYNVLMLYSIQTFTGSFDLPPSADGFRIHFTYIDTEGDKTEICSLKELFYALKMYKDKGVVKIIAKVEQLAGARRVAQRPAAATVPVQQRKNKRSQGAMGGSQGQGATASRRARIAQPVLAQAVLAAQVAIQPVPVQAVQAAQAAMPAQAVHAAQVAIQPVPVQAVQAAQAAMPAQAVHAAQAAIQPAPVRADQGMRRPIRERRQVINTREPAWVIIEVVIPYYWRPCRLCRNKPQHGTGRCVWHMEDPTIFDEAWMAEMRRRGALLLDE